jgi:hypothetical protein
VESGVRHFGGCGGGFCKWKVSDFVH